MVNKFLAEFFGTFWLVFGGCGSAVLAAKFFAGPDQIGIGLVGVSLAFGLTVVTMAYAIGHVSGCHLNPAVTFGLLFSGRLNPLELIPYLVAQVVGGLAGALVLFVIASGQMTVDGTESKFKPGTELAEIDRKISEEPDTAKKTALEHGKAGAFATNGYGTFSPNSYSVVACFLAEFVLTFFFLLIILGATDGRAPSGFAGLAIGLGLTLIHLIGIPLTNLSVNPARSTGPALILGFLANQWFAVSQLWLFWAAPIAGGALGGIVYNVVAPKVEKSA